MADTKYTVIRTDLMSGTKQPADLVSLRFYDAEGKTAEVENGVIVKLEGYEELLLQEIGVSPKEYRITDIQWNGDPYEDETGGVLPRRNGRGTENGTGLPADIPGDGRITFL